MTDCQSKVKIYSEYALSNSQSQIQFVGKAVISYFKTIFGLSLKHFHGRSEPSAEYNFGSNYRSFSYQSK